MGKTSIPHSPLNLPGRIAWLTMEIPGFLTLLYHLYVLPSQLPLPPSPDGSLPWQTQTLAFLFVFHYIYRAILFPFLQPSMSPVHLFIWLLGVTFQLVNGTVIGAWLAGYGPMYYNHSPAQTPISQFALGLIVFYLGLASNYFHDDHLREIRRRVLRRQQLAAQKPDDSPDAPKSVEKHYEIPQAGLFKVVLYPHYLSEWIEWVGYWIAAGWGCVPARCFVLNEVTAMLPRAVRGRQWYVERFGEETVGRRWAVIPGVW